DVDERDAVAAGLAGDGLDGADLVGGDGSSVALEHDATTGHERLGRGIVHAHPQTAADAVSAGHVAHGQPPVRGWLVASRLAVSWTGHRRARLEATRGSPGRRACEAWRRRRRGSPAWP